MTGNGDRIAVVTGGAQGIGAATVAVLVESGFRVVVLDRAPQALERVRDRYRGRADVWIGECDITQEDQLRTAIDEATRQLGGPVHTLVNNAGISAYFDPAEMTVAQWDSVFAVDLKGLWLVSRSVIPQMRAARAGSIVNIASVHAHVTMPGMFPYAAAKSGVLGLTRSLALDLGPAGIRVNAVSPGYTRTEMVQEWLDRQDDPAEAERKVLASHALGRICEPREVAQAIAFLASDLASAITGTELVVDAGLTARFAS